MKATILLAVVVAVIVGVQEVQSVPCASTICAWFCGSKGCLFYRCSRLHPVICYCYHCRRAESPLALSGSARNVNEQNKEMDNSPMMNEMEHLDQEMDMS
ncbi:myticin-A-like isoform X2 [Mytilus galloprovincialis]|uniref:myticin-A-like isoform X2 n=1 Tax=Mytilus galloprovincialis TaxID=29158 RepID=UPI003F7C8EBA